MPLIPTRDLIPIFRASLDAHASPEERAALRAGLEVAVGICDLVAKKIEGDHRWGGRITRTGKKQAAVARGIAETVWAVRGEVG